MSAGGWHVTHDVEEFRREAEPYLEADPAGNTVPLTVAETVRRHGPRALGTEDARFGFWRRNAGGPVEAVFVQTPPRDPLLGPMPEVAARQLAETLRGTRVEGVKGGDGPARAFAAAWTAPGESWAVTRRSRLFRLGELAPPRPAPPGTARRATAADVPLAAAWMSAFAAEIGVGPTVDHTANAERRVAYGGLYVWETGGRPVSMAAHSPLVAGQSRVAPVYTPPELRGRGYAGAVTAAASRAAQDAGARQVLLFADVANPTSTALYQRLGYRPVADHVDVGFA
ncbi:GNAT family N-acetyltransferase [Streptomyces sp. CB03238]|uniref:GNAT family N-acetyltransferase n=1 Tax=Streptomyces sp. CB03238 TaxID=1907777 RepID=UPI000A11F736|nr:GNAT family N-acetyltransferase [Streptomyces sp. CB03238]ORT60420.1 GNAT family N-acetyltransferase [Streptomyces sp. CB03238]